jgi:hypothetical protein
MRGSDRRPPPPQSGAGPEKKLGAPLSARPKPALVGVERANRARPLSRARRWREGHFSPRPPLLAPPVRNPLCTTAHRRRSRLLRVSPGQFRQRASCHNPLPPFPAVEGPQRPHLGGPQRPHLGGPHAAGAQLPPPDSGPSSAPPKVCNHSRASPVAASPTRS